MALQARAEPRPRPSWRAGPRLRRTAAGAVLGGAVLACLVAGRLDALPVLLPHLRGWDDVVQVALAGNVHGPWRVMRGGLKYLVAPGLVVVVVACLRDLRAHGRTRSAAVAALVAAGAYGTVEALKAGVVPLPGWAHDSHHVMSGHVAASSAALVVVIVAARRSVGLVAVLGGVVVAGAGALVVLARWHTVDDGVSSTVVATAWALAGAVAVRVATGRRRTAVETAAVRSVRNAVGASGVLLVLAACVSLAVVEPSQARATAGMGVLALLLAGAALVVAAAALELAAALRDMDLRDLDTGPADEEGGH